MALTTYRRKRNFARTPEPRGREYPSHAQRLYVIQKHAASRLHYDLRLEDQGVLKSWAVPKGPSLDPQEKRLAVQVEDHPVEYASFEGIIPEGQYGAGTVQLWDRGHWTPVGDPAAGFRTGRLKFRLEGEKLKGSWNLIRLRAQESDKPNWLLIKERDEHAASGKTRDIVQERPESVASGQPIEAIKSASHHVWQSNRVARGKRTPAQSVLPDVSHAKKGSLPKLVRFQLATLIDEPPPGEGWLHEIKYDGFRMQCRIERGTVQLLTRRGQDWTHRFPEVAAAAGRLAVETALLDGEIVALGPQGHSSFQSLQRALTEGHGATLVYYAFDLLHLNGYDLTRAPLEDRKRVLRHLIGVHSGEKIRYSDHVVGNGKRFYTEACRLKLEGMISKRRDAPYRPGRGREWIKVKCLNRQEFVIGGFTEPSGARVGIGALLLGVYESGRFVYAGRVGTGFNDRLLQKLRSRLNRLEQTTSPFHRVPPGPLRGVHWVRPDVVVEVAFSEWTAEGLLRHPSFQGIREDKAPHEVTREMPQHADRPAGKGGVSAPPGHGKRARLGVPGDRAGATAGEAGKGGVSAPPGWAGEAGEKAQLHARQSLNEERIEIAGIRLTHPRKILYPQQGLTKFDLATYYQSMAERILPHLAGRPVMVVRCPDGQGRQCFHQKHVNKSVPDAVHAVEIEEEAGKKAPYLMVDDLPGLMALVQMGALELHVWGARAERLEHPDRMVFDLDPDEALPWGSVVETAKRLRSRLAKLGLQSWVKTTGGKGLHVVVPLTGKDGWDEIKAFSKAVADAMVKEAPERYTSKMAKAGRKGKIFIDYLRNSRGATAVVAYSTRARAGATVSMPLQWEQLSRVKPLQFTAVSIAERSGRFTQDPWKELWTVRQSITSAARRAVGLK